MKVELVTKNEAENLGLIKSRLLHEGYGCWGEPDNSYEDVIYIGNKVVRLSDGDLVLFQGESPNREVIQIISEWECSDKILELINPKGLKKRNEERKQKYIELKKEFE